MVWVLSGHTKPGGLGLALTMVPTIENFCHAPEKMTTQQPYQDNAKGMFVNASDPLTKLSVLEFNIETHLRYYELTTIRLKRKK